jgi:23S rRNA (guanosine2251-2'-O)-methyltransferase
MSNKYTIVILDNVRSAFNVGAIFRTCDAAAIDELHLVGITPIPPLDKLEKTSIGSIKFVKWHHFKTISESLEKIKNDDRYLGTSTIITSVEQTDRSITYTNAPLNADKMAFIFGHEIMGVSPYSIAGSELIIDLPMLGKKNSLNVATTVGIVLYERLRQINVQE